MNKVILSLSLLMTTALCAAQQEWHRISENPFLAPAPKKWAWGYSCINPQGASFPSTSVDYRYSKDVTGASATYDGIGWSEACVSLKSTPSGGHSYVFQTAAVTLSYRQSYNHYVQWSEYKQVRQPALANPEDPEIECWGCIDIIVKLNDEDEVIDEKTRQTLGTTADKKNMSDFYEIVNNPGGTGGGD